MKRFSLHYFPPISFWSLWKQSDKIVIEGAENYQKGSFRNRMHIASPSGLLPLSVPLLKGKNSQMPFTEVQVDNSQKWQQNHWRSITAAYGKSPFFEHYADDLRPIFQTNWEQLFDLNMAALLLMKSLLYLDNQSFILSEKYEIIPQQEDFRRIIRPNRDINHRFVEYVQVFADKTGFVPNLSILDLLFCMGPEAQRFL